MFSEIQEDFPAMYQDVKNSNKEILKGKTSFYVFVIAWNRVKSKWILNWYLVVSFPPQGYLHFPSVGSTDLAILLIEMQIKDQPMFTFEYWSWSDE